MSDGAHRAYNSGGLKKIERQGDRETGALLCLALSTLPSYPKHARLLTLFLIYTRQYIVHAQ